MQSRVYFLLDTLQSSQRHSFMIYYVHFSVSNQKILAMTALINRMFDVYKRHSLSLFSFSLVCSGAFCKFNPFHFLILKAINCASTFSLLSVNLQMVMPNTPSFFVSSCANANLVHSRSLNRSNVFFQKRPALFQHKGQKRNEKEH